MRSIRRFHNSRAQGVSGKNEQLAQTEWRGAQCSCIGCIGLSPALLTLYAQASNTYIASQTYHK